MSRKATPTEWETKLCKKLGVEYSTIDETHKFLSESLPFYKKVTSVVIPPIHSSIDFLHNNVCSDPETRARQESSTEVAKRDIDVAKLIEAEGCSISVLNALLAALTPVGISLLRHVYKSFLDNAKKDSSEEVPQEVIEYLESNLSAEDQSEELGSQTTKNQDSRLSFASPLRPGSDKKRYHSAHSIPTKKITQNYLPPSLDVEESVLQGLDLSAILAEIEIPPEAERTPWENSFLKKMDFMDTDQFQIVHFVDSSNDDGYTPKNLEIIKFFTAQKLQRVFNLSPKDEVHDRYECWLLRDVLLQGHIFVTREAICFYLLLPGKVQNPESKDPDVALHEGALGHGDSYFSSGKTTKTWAILGPRSLSLYSSPTKLLFPIKVIDLSNALYCQLVETVPSASSTNLRSDKLNPVSGVSSPTAYSEASSIAEDQEDTETVFKGVWFKIVCTDKVYKFQTQGIYSARHWVTALTKVIFSLRNTNSHQEVILKIPVEEILDYHKKIILVDEDGLDQESSLAENYEVPVAFSLSYNLPAQEVRESLKQLHMKSGTDDDCISTSDSVNFLIFRRGDELFLLMDSVCDEYMKAHVGSSQESIFSVVAGPRETLHLNSRHVTSTLQPEYLSGTSIINKIESVNHEIQAYRQEQYYTYKDGKIVSPHSEEKNVSEKESRVMKALALSDRIFSHSSIPQVPLSSSNVSVSSDLFDESDMETCESFEQIWEHDPIVNLPKPFTLLTLRNSGMVIRAQHRNVHEVVIQYKIMLELEEENELKKRTQTRVHSASSLQSNSSDLSEDDNRSNASSKLKLIKRSVKSVTTMGGFWLVKPEHFDIEKVNTAFYVADSKERVKAVDRFRNYFSLGSDSVLVASYYTHLKRTMPVYGRIYISNDKLCFRSVLPGISTKMIMPITKIQLCKKGSQRKSHYYSEAIKVKGMDEVVFEFGSAELRDDFHETIKSQLEKELEFMNEGSTASSGKLLPVAKGRPSFDPDRFYRARIRAARLRLLEDRISVASGIDFPLILEDNPIIFTEVVTAKPYNISLLTIGSRGDVQPYIALGKELLREGHSVTIATHSEFRDWILQHGIEHREVAGDPAELMQLMVTHGSLSVAFLKEAHAKFKDWIVDLLETSWLACQGADLIIESPSAMGGIHIAEALGIPYIRAFTMPWTRSKAYPHAFIVPDQKRGGSYNLLTHVMFENIFWKGISGQVNSWREKTLGLPKTNLSKLQQSRIPFIYNVSPSILPPSVDFPDWVKVSGYWFLNEGNQDYKPPSELEEFLLKAQDERKKIIYVGFGSIVVSDANALTRTIVDSVMELGVMCILNKGWSDRLSKSEASEKVVLPPEVFECGSIPHDWLFARVDVAVHHGGSGTTGASLRAGLPTIIKPFFGDQFFYATRIEDLGVGLSLKTLTQKTFTKAIKSLILDRKYKLKAEEIANMMLKERGVLSAIEAIYTELAYSRSVMMLIKQNSKLK